MKKDKSEKREQKMEVERHKKLVVEFIRNSQVGSCRYRKGEVASFAEKMAKNLVEQKHAKMK